jgi:hypothetical protein
MPQITNITVKKADGVTDQVLVAVQPSAGDGVAARWRAEAGFPSPAVMPTVTLSSRANGAKTGRRVDIRVTYPHYYLDNTKGNLPVVMATEPVTISWARPDLVPNANARESAALVCNFLASQAMRDVIMSMYAPT